MKQQNQTEDPTGPMKMIFNYNNIFFSFFYDDTSGCIHRSREFAGCIHRSREFAMNYVYSGEMLLDNGKEQIHVGKGECVFIPRDHHITMYKRTANGEKYCGIFLMFTRNFLKEMYTKSEQYKAPANTPKLDSGVIKLPKNHQPFRLHDSLFRSERKTARRPYATQTAGRIACLAPYRQAFCSYTFRFQ